MSRFGAIAVAASLISCTTLFVPIELSKCWPNRCAAADAGASVDAGCVGPTCTATCGCEDWAADVATSALPMRVNPGVSLQGRTVEVGFDGDQTLAVVVTDNQRVTLAIRRVDGSFLRATQLIATNVGPVVSISWSGTQWVAAWHAVGGTVTTVMLAVPDGTPRRLANLSRVALAVAGVGDDTYLASVEGGQASVQRFDAELNESGPPVLLPSFGAITAMQAVGDSVVVVGVDTTGNIVQGAVIRGLTLVAEPRLKDFGVPASLGAAEVAGDASTALACWSSANDLWCRGLSLSDGTPGAPALLVLPMPAVAWSVAQASCGASVLTGHQFENGPAGSSRMHQLDGAGGFKTTRVDYRWEQPQRTLRLFSTIDGRLIRVQEASGQLVISKLSCRAGVPVLAECGALVTEACVRACERCDAGATECAFLQGNGAGFGFQRSTCPMRMGAIIDCAVINGERCEETLAAPLACTASGWAIPAACVSPR